MLKFAVFADLHYKKGMYTASVSSLEAILRRAADAGVDFIIHAGDFSNDYGGSPEITRTYLSNPFDLPVYGIVGNHETETAGNTVAVVRPLLCNRPVSFGAADGGQWWADVGDYRLIALDTNYSNIPDTDIWEHNGTVSWTARKGNLGINSLGPAQLAWLERTIADAAGQGRPVIVFSHAAMAGTWSSSPDAAAVRAVFARYPGTVRLAINGHLHTDHFAVVDGIPYFDVNTVHNGFWKPCPDFHYADDQTYLFTDYDTDGKPLGEPTQTPLNSLRQAKNTWFFTEPLSAIVTLCDDGKIIIEGSETAWVYGIAPPFAHDGVKPAIESRRWRP